MLVREYLSAAEGLFCHVHGQSIMLSSCFEIVQHFDFLKQSLSCQYVVNAQLHKRIIIQLHEHRPVDRRSQESACKVTACKLLG